MGFFDRVCQPSQIDQRHVVIIGGGYGGMELASLMMKWNVPFTLIDPKEYFHHNVGALRAVVDESYMSKTTIDYKNTFGSSFCLGTVTNIDLENKSVSVEKYTDDEQLIIEYTDLVVAVGSNGPFPSRIFSQKAEDAAKEYKELGNEIEKSQNIVIVGGGAVGVEFAGEIVDKYPEKHITIIHSKDKLVTKNFGDKFCENIKEQLERSFKVKILLDERVTNLDHLIAAKSIKQIVETNKDNMIEADIILKCTGLRPNISLTTKTFAPDAFEDDEGRRLKVDDKLLIKGQTNVYAIGDCCNTKEEKLGAHAANHAKTVAWNIWRDMEGKEKQPYSQAFSGILVTLGRIGGAGIIFGWQIPSFIVGVVKSRSLFTSKYWDLMGQKMPS